MTFELLGIPVWIRGWFWIGAVMLALASSGGISPLVSIPLWIAVAFVSILVHELGHAVAVRRHGLPAEIVLHGMGGTTHHPGSRHLTRTDLILISAAGPAFGLALGGIAYLVLRLAPPLPLLASYAVGLLCSVNIGWSVFNLIPVLPFDGGHILEHALGPSRAKLTAGISLGLACVLAAVCARFNQIWAAVLFGMSAMRSYQLYTLPEGAVLVDNATAAPRAVRGGRGAVGGEPLSAWRRFWLERRYKKLQGEMSNLRRPERSSSKVQGRPELRVIRGGAADPPKDKRFLN